MIRFEIPVSLRAKAQCRFLPLALAAVLALAACSGDKKKDDYVERPATALYEDGMNELTAKRYKAAAKNFEEVERQHPYSAWAVKAQMMAAYAYYQEGKFDDAVIALDRFIELYPADSQTSYAYYLKALCYYEQISDVERDQQMTMQAREALNEVIKRYPQTEYARDARMKLDLTTDHLAGKEMDIGRYYLKRGDYLPAINRFQTVVDTYQTTTHAAEALYRLVEANTALGLTGEANKYAAVLGYNYPGSEWYAMAYVLIKPEDQADLPQPESESWTRYLWPF